MNREIRFASERGFRIVQVDEMMVTKRTILSSDWSLPKNNPELDLSNINTSPIAVLGGVSQEFGIDLVMTFKFSIDTAKFKVFLDELRAKYWADDILLVMDNLSVHKSIIMKERMDELGFMYCYIPAYSPWYNGIEEVWAMSKLYIKRERFRKLMNNEKIDMVKLINESF